VPGVDVRFVSGDVAPVYDELVAAADGMDVWVVGAATSSVSSPTPDSSTRCTWG
jgi:hypothetical protein